MASKCIEDLKAAVEAVKADYGSDPKWAEVISHAEKAVSSAEQVESPAPDSPGKQSANAVHDESKETPATENAESPAVQKQEQDSGSEEPMKEAKDMKGAAQMAILMLRNRKK
jgi:hypothetical protein